MTSRPLNLLLADDSQSDLLLIEMALDSTGLKYTLHTSLDGLEALQTLQDNHRQNNLPDYLLLDLNMPRSDGFDVLSNLQKNPDLAALPVIVLTTSDARRDQERARNLGAKAFVTKPLNFDDLISIFQQLHAHWQGNAELPGQWEQDT